MTKYNSGLAVGSTWTRIALGCDRRQRARAITAASESDQSRGRPGRAWPRLHQARSEGRPRRTRGLGPPPRRPAPWRRRRGAGSSAPWSTATVRPAGISCKALRRGPPRTLGAYLPQEAHGAPNGHGGRRSDPVRERVRWRARTRRTLPAPSCVVSATCTTRANVLHGRWGAARTARHQLVGRVHLEKDAHRRGFLGAAWQDQPREGVAGGAVAVAR